MAENTDKLPQLSFNKLSLNTAIAILLTNAVPIIGVFVFNWSALAIITMYWLESVVIGGFNIIKIILNQGGPDPDLKLGETPSSELSTTYVKGCLVPFFIFHYGLFMGIQGVFMGVYAVVFAFPANLWWGVVTIFINQLFGLFYGYLYKGEYQRVKIGVLFFQPYPRVFIQQFVAIIGSFFMTFLNSNLGALIVFITIKTIADFIGAILIAEKKTKLES